MWVQVQHREDEPQGHQRCLKPRAACGLFADEEPVLHGLGDGLDPHLDGRVGIGMHHHVGIPRGRDIDEGVAS